MLTSLIKDKIDKHGDEGMPTIVLPFKHNKQVKLCFVRVCETETHKENTVEPCTLAQSDHLWANSIIFEKFEKKMFDFMCHTTTTESGIPREGGKGRD